MSEYSYHCIFCRTHWLENPEVCSNCNSNKGIVECDPTCPFGEYEGNWKTISIAQLYTWIEGLTIVKVENYDETTQHLYLRRGRSYYRLLVPKFECQDSQAEYFVELDPYLEAASFIFQKPKEEVTPEERKICKTVNFDQLYSRKQFQEKI